MMGGGCNASNREEKCDVALPWWQNFWNSTFFLDEAVIFIVEGQRFVEIQKFLLPWESDVTTSPSSLLTN